MDGYLNYFGFEQLKNTSVVLAASFFTLLIVYIVSKWFQMRQYLILNKLPGPVPIPFIGDSYKTILKGMRVHDEELIRKYGKTCVYYELSRPTVLTIDTDFIKTVLIKDFNSFVNRRKHEELKAGSYPWNKFLTNLLDDEWKTVRTLASPTFTSGKLKSMSKLISKTSNNFNQYLEKLIEKENGVFDTKGFFGGYTFDVISTCAFGVEVNSINDPNNKFLNSIKLILARISSVKGILFGLFPKYFSMIMDFFPREPTIYIEAMTQKIIEMRKKGTTSRRDDFIQHMIDHEESVDNNSNTIETDKSANEETQDEVSGLKKWTVTNFKKVLSFKEIIAQSFIFLIAGYETTATTLGFVAYNLATNPESQEKLLNEIDQVLEKYNGEINYDSVNEMDYLEMVICETLRLYSPISRIPRIASRDYEYNGIKIKKGHRWAVPIHALHYDPTVYPEPTKFIPERFSEQSKKQRSPVSFLPFGAGPRNCIGMRFALIEMKLLLAEILVNYKFIKSPQTPDQIKLIGHGLIQSDRKIIIQIQKRF